jgi:RNA polymerase sigma factor (sigma-70 family)
MRPDKTIILPAESEIIDTLKQNGPQRTKAEEQLFNKFAYFIREGMNKYALTEEDTFDVYADSILSVIEKIRNGLFEGRSSLKTYLYRIFHNKCVDQIRKITTNKNKIYRTSTTLDLLMNLSDSAKSVVQKLIERSDFDLLKRNLAELGENCRKLLELFADGFSDKEIAIQLEYKTAEVVKTSRLRCLDRLRQSYNLLKK